MVARASILSFAILLLAFSPSAAAETRLGSKITDFRLPDHMGKEHSLAEFADRDVVVVAFLGTECPLAKLYAGRLQSIADEYAKRGVAVMIVMPNVQDSLEDIAAFVRQHSLAVPVLKDMRNQVADQFGAERTPQAFVLNRDRKICYRGRIDDQYLVGIVRNKPTREDLRLAIDEVLSKKNIEVPETDAVGCIIGRAHQSKAESEVTYCRDIAPILQAHCVECHRPGEIGPFELSSYSEAAGWGEMMAEVVRQRRMPPWHASPKFGVFANARTMPDKEKELLYTWVKNGCPEGDKEDLPAPRKFTRGWQLPRDPDIVLSMPEPFTVPADGGREGVPYQYFRVATKFDEDKWITGAEVLPGNPAVVHHTIIYVVPPDGNWERDRIFLSAYVPGLRLDPFPGGAAKRIPANSTVVFEMHYTPNGSEQKDTTKVGLLLADLKQVDKELITTEVGNLDFVIPPQAAEHLVTASSRPTKQDVTLVSLSPHMHVRGKAFRYELVLPTGEREVLLDVPKYDFNWQTRYVLAEPRNIPTGSVISCRAVFDNSEANLANPDPQKSVKWGEQTWDEMMLGFFDVMVPRDDARQAGKKPVVTGLDIVGTFDASDANHDGGLSEKEVDSIEILKRHFGAIDQNHDELLQLKEIVATVRAMPEPRRRRGI